MASSPKAETAEAPPKKSAKSKKLLIIIIGAVLVLGLGGIGAFIYISKQRAAAADGEDTASAKTVTHSATPAKPPAYLPMDNMVINLADPGGEKVAQIGITLEVVDSHAVEEVKAFLPTIRSSVLLLISRETAEDLLSYEGKQKLRDNILQLATVPFGGKPPAMGASDAPMGHKAVDHEAHAEYPVTGVLFTSFIVQ